MDRDIWRRYSEAVAALPELFEQVSTELDEVNRAEGLRHLTRALHMGMFSVHDYADTANPRVFLAKTPAMLSGGVTSDCIYHEAFIDGRRSYRLRGTRGTAALLEISVYQGRLGLGDRADLVAAVLEDTLVVDRDARFEVVLSPDPRPAGFDGNWLCTADPVRGTASWLLIRQYDACIGEVEPARVVIEPREATEPRAALTLDAVDTALGDSVAFARRLVAHFARKGDNIVRNLANRFVVVDEEGAGGEAMPAGHRFAAGGFRLAPDEAWIVTVRGIGAPPYDRAPYWGFQLCNFWFEPFDYGDTWGHRNNATAAYEPDGSVRLVISERRPPAGHDRNWLPLRGHAVGSAQFRLSRVDAPMPLIDCEVVAGASLPRC